MKHLIFFSLLLCAGIISVSHASDTLYVETHITDTLYVIDGPDTVYMAVSKEAPMKIPLDSSASDSLGNTTNSREVKEPGRAIHVSYMSGMSIIGIFFKILPIDLTYEIETKYRSSILLSLSSFTEFGDFEFVNPKEWDGFRTITNLGIGYRQYIVTGKTLLENEESKKHKLINNPYGSISLFLQGEIFPGFMYRHEVKLDDDGHKKGDYHRDNAFGTSFVLTPGLSYTIGHSVWTLGWRIGYQYWSHNFSNFGLVGKDEGFAFQPGVANGGVYQGFIFSIGF